MTILANVFSLMLACLVGVGPVALLAALQNRRDRRAGRSFTRPRGSFRPRRSGATSR